MRQRLTDAELAPQNLKLLFKANYVDSMFLLDVIIGVSLSTSG